MSVVWNPVDHQDIESKKAFDALSRSADKVIIAPGVPGQPNRFILHSKGFFDLQAYVLSGKEFPTSYPAFDAKISEDSFKKLSAIDKKIHEKTRSTMVAIGSSCLDFHENQLTKLVTASETAILYSKNAIALLATGAGVNLRHHLDIILNEKYTSSEKFDDAYRQATVDAQMTLSMLKDDANDKFARTNEIVQSLIRFKDQTLRSQPDVRSLLKQYQGPLDEDSAQKMPYLDYLHKDLADSLVTLNNKVKDAQDTYADWGKNTAVSVSTCFLGLAGWIVMGIHAAKAANLRRAYNELQGVIEGIRKDRQGEADLITFVNQMTIQCTAIEDKMADAIKAMSDLSLLFSNQAQCYGAIHTSLGQMKASADLGALVSRKTYIEWSLGICVNKLEELQVVAEEFSRSILNREVL